MNFEIIKKIELGDGSKRYILKINEAEKLYLGYFLESFENLCIYSSYKENDEKVFYVDIPPDMLNSFNEILNFLRNYKL